MAIISISNKRDKSDFKIYSIARVSIYLLLFGGLINNVFQVGVQYLYLVVSLMMILPFVLNKSIDVLMGVYLLVVILLFVYSFFLTEGLSYKYYSSFVYYVAIPFAYGRGNLFVNQYYYNKLLYGLLVVVIPNAIVVLMQSNGLYVNLFPVEYTRISDVVYVRCTGVLGGSLINGLVSALCLIIIIYRALEEKKYKTIDLLLFVLSLYALLLSYSRGAYVLLMVAVFVIVYKMRILSFKGVKRPYVVFFIVLFVAVILFYNDVVLERIYSIFDFSQGGNLLRYDYWLRSLQVFKDNMILGAGLGMTSTVGGSDSSMVIAGDASIAESYYLKLMVEGGIMLLISFLPLVFYGIKKSLKEKNELLFSAIFIAITIETFIMPSLESPLISIIYWLCWGALMKRSFSELRKRYMGFAFKD
uniref:O-antigen polymerase n=1 Tax=Chlorobium phaeobacteroides (strain BS1) TaxID=331678 RepID=B3EM01_CHLPB